MSRKTLLNIDYALIQGTYWMFYAVAGMFVSVYMLGKGYSNTSIGLVIAVGNVVAVFVQAVLANITDKAQRLTDITVIKVLIAVLFALTVAVLLIGDKSLLLTIVYTALIVVHTALHPFVNSLSFTLEESGEHVSFGIGRSMGSLSAALLGLAMGYLVTGFGVDVIPFSGLIILVMMEAIIIVAGRHHARFRQGGREIPGHETGGGEEAVSLTEFVSGNMVFMVMSVGVVALFFGNVIVENFTIQIIESIGGDTEQLGVMIFVMAILEMPAMLFFDRIKKRFSYIFLMRVAAIFFTVKITLMYLAGSMGVMYAAQACQVLGYGLMFPAMVSFIDDIMSRGEAVRGQAVFTTAITVGNVLGCIFGGRILDLSTVGTLLLISAMITAAGTILICCTVSRVKRKNIERDAV